MSLSVSQVGGNFGIAGLSTGGTFKVDNSGTDGLESGMQCSSGLGEGLVGRDGVVGTVDFRSSVTDAAGACITRPFPKGGGVYKAPLAARLQKSDDDLWDKFEKIRFVVFADVSSDDIVDDIVGGPVDLL
jgi:hypothetical protein